MVIITIMPSVATLFAQFFYLQSPISNPIPWVTLGIMKIQVLIDRNLEQMDAFSPFPPVWTQTAIHGLKFCCPRCHAPASQSQNVWINRQAPVLGEDYRRKWQEFYQCECEQVWWAWSSDRPPSNLTKPAE